MNNIRDGGHKMQADKSTINWVIIGVGLIDRRVNIALLQAQKNSGSGLNAPFVSRQACIYHSPDYPLSSKMT